MKFRMHPFAESRVRRRMETAAGVVDDHHVPAPVQLGDQEGPDEVVGHASAGVPIMPDVGGARRDELLRLQPQVDTANDGDRPMLPSDRAAFWAIRSVLQEINGSYQCRGFRSNSFSKFELPISAWDFGIRLSSVSGARGERSGGRNEARFSFGASQKAR